MVTEKEGTMPVVLKVCPTAEDLQLKPAATASRLMCPVQGCPSLFFKTQGSLTQHLNAIHPNYNPYRVPAVKGKGEEYHFHCPQAGCVYNATLQHRWFASLDQLRYHFVNTHDEKRFACGKCGKRFGWQRDQEHHELECGQTFACGTCSASYTSRRPLLTHCLRKQHPVPPQFEKPAQKLKAKTATKSKQAASACGSTLLVKPLPLQPVPASTSSTTPPSLPPLANNVGAVVVSGSSPSVQPVVVSGSGTIQPVVVSCGGPSIQPVVVSVSHRSDITVSSSSSDHPVPVSATSPWKLVTVQSKPRHKLRPILPKVSPVMASGQGVSAHFINSERGGSGATTDLTPDMRGDGKVGDNNGHHGSAVSAGCQTAQPSHTGTEGSQAPVAHMAIQVGTAARHVYSDLPLQVCHIGTQVCGSGGVTLDSQHMGVQTCQQTMHNATQLAASLPTHSIAVETVDTQTSGAASSELAGGREVCAVAIQTGGYVDMVNMAIQATTHLSDLAGGDGASMCDTSLQDSGSLSGTHIASQASFPFILLNKGNATITTGTQAAPDAVCQESEVASTGMQTSVTLLQRPRSTVMAAQTQTTGDAILQSAMASADLPVLVDTSRKTSRGVGSTRRRKKSTMSSEVQTYPCSPRRRKRKLLGNELSVKKDKLQIQDVSIPTQTVTDSAVQHRGTLSSQSMAASSSHEAKQWTGAHSDRSDNKTHKWSNPTLSLSATKDDDQDGWEPLFTHTFPTSTSTSPPALPSQLDDLLSSYTSDLGVQTQDDFLLALTADFGMQTQACAMSTTAEFGVQTLDTREELCTAEFGVQTMASSLGALLDDLDNDLVYTTLQDAREKATSCSMVSLVGTRLETNVSFQTQISTPTISIQNLTSTKDCGMHVDTSLPSLQTASNSRLFDSFDSDLSFSDCGTATEDFLASTHTQTISESDLIPSEDFLQPGLSSLQAPPDPGTSMSHSYLHDAVDIAGNSQNTLTSCVPLIPAADNPDKQHQAEPGSLDNYDLTLDFYQSDTTSQQSTLTSSSTTDTDFLSGVPASNMHTQTADDLLDFLMKNMETQTTEDLCENHLSVADTDTQTSSVLRTPPHPSSSHSSPSWLSLGGELVTVETQTSDQVMWEWNDDSGDLFDLVDMQTQTSLW